MECKVETITPEVALALLASNTANRPLNESNVAFFVSQLKRGEMLLTHQGIAVSSTGRLLDGQHRCTAIVRTGISAQMLVVRGLPENVFAVLDTGSKRTPGDVLAIDGAVNSSGLASGIRMFIMYENCPQLVWVGALVREQCTSTSIIDVYHSDKSTWQACARIAAMNTLNKVCVPSGIVSLAYLAVKRNGYSLEFLEEFAAVLKEGSNLQAGHPFLAYRNKMMATQSAYCGTQRQQSRLADYIKLFNAYVTGQRLKIFKSQVFPPMPSLIHASEAVESFLLNDSGAN